MQIMCELRKFVSSNYRNFPKNQKANHMADNRRISEMRDCLQDPIGKIAKNICFKTQFTSLKAPK